MFSSSFFKLCSVKLTKKLTQLSFLVESSFAILIIFIISLAYFCLTSFGTNEKATSKRMRFVKSSSFLIAASKSLRKVRFAKGSTTS